MTRYEDLMNRADAALEKAREDIAMRSFYVSEFEELKKRAFALTLEQAEEAAK